MEGRSVGYTYATVEGRDWNALLDEDGRQLVSAVVTEVEMTRSSSSPSP